MTDAERLLLKATIKRLEFLAPIAEEKGSVLVSSDTLAETAACLKALCAELQEEGGVPRYLSLVRMKQSAKDQLTPEGVATYFPDRPKDHHLHGKSAQFIFMGEIPNQPGHCVVLLVGKLALEPVGFHHTHLFEEVPEDEA